MRFATTFASWPTAGSDPVVWPRRDPGRPEGGHQTPPMDHGGTLKRSGTRQLAHQPLPEDLWLPLSGRDPFPASTRY